LAQNSCHDELSICIHMFKLGTCACFKEWLTCLDDNKYVIFQH
jgi:hypothetical protein